MIGLQEGPHAGDLDPLTIEALMLRRGWRRRWPAPGDLVRMTIGSCVVLLAALAARRSDPSLVEANIFRLVNQFPSATGAPLLGVMQVGALAAVPVVAVAALFARRRQLARAIVVGGVTAWGLAKLLQHAVAQRPPAEVLRSVMVHGGSRPGFSFPSTHVAVAAALATVASPYLSRAARRASWIVVATVAIARMYTGGSFPADVLGGAAVGWVLGTATRVALRPSGEYSLPALLRVQLATLGFRGSQLEPLVSTTRGSAVYRQTGDDGTQRFVKVVGRDQPDADWLYRLWRLVAFRDLGDSHVFVSPQHRVEHEALMTLLAQRSGASTAIVDGAGPVSESESALVCRWVDGRSLGDIVEPSDAVVAHCWEQVARLHAAGIAHGTLRTDSIIVDTAGSAVLTNFDTSSVGASAEQLSRDVAELCASTALLVGPCRSVAIAAGVLGEHRVADALPLIQPLSLSTPTRRALAQSPGQLEALRTAVARLTGVEAPKVELPYRVATRNLFPLAVAGFAVFALLAQAGNVNRTIAAARGAHWGWLAVAALLAALTYVAAGIALIGASPRPLAVGRTIVVQLAAAFTNRLAPAGLGGMATNIRYLERAGAERPEAITAVGVNSVAGFVVHAIALALIVPMANVQSRRLVPSVDIDWMIPLLGLSLITAGGLVYWGLRIERVREGLRQAFIGIGSTLRRPNRAAALFGGAAGVTTCHALALVASVQAFSIHVPVFSILAVFLAGGAVAAVAPTPGGLGALEAALVAGLVHIGAPGAPAVAAVLTSRLVTYWAPVLPGAVAFRSLYRRKVI
jgi:undecaprenyl-diphosphatase